MIKTNQLVKRYGDTPAVDGVELDVSEGSVYGLVGPNGAGKTTLLGLLAGLRQPTSGSLHIAADHEDIAVLPDTPRFDQWLTGREVVALAQHLSTGVDDPEAVDAVLEEAGIGNAAERRVGGYSRGMLQRLGIAATVIGSPRLLLLDEPASALDPQGRREVLDLVARLRGSATVLFSSHILGDVQEVCDTVGILDQGHLLFQGPIRELLVGSAVPQYVIRLRPPIEPVAKVLRNQPWITDVAATGGEELVITVSNLDDVELKLLGALSSAEARVVSIGPKAVTLEQAFLEVTR